VEGKIIAYYPNPLLLIGSFAAVAVLGWLAYRYKDSRISTNSFPLFPPFVFGVAGFLFQLLNLIIPNALARNSVHPVVTIVVQLALISCALLFTVYQILHPDTTKSHLAALIFGALTCFILFTPLQEFGNGAHGMLAVGIICFLLLIKWRLKVLQAEKVESAL